MTGRDVVWITLESVRRDHTSLASHARDTTPNLSTLAAEATEFEQCFSHDVWTRSSSASILTGLPPSAHRTWSDDAKLPEEIETIPEAFRTAGYRTACITSNGQLGPATGLDRGFEQFHYLSKSTLLAEAGPVGLGKWLLNLRRHSGGLTRDGNQHCVGYLSNRLAKRTIDDAAADDEPLFLYVHHGDSHHAYVPPIAWRDRFVDDLPMPVDEAVDLALEMSSRLHELIAQDEPFTPEEWQALRVLYDTSLAYVDHLTGDLVAHARRRLDDPVVVVTADHGELFGERGLLAHMLVANAAVSNVPLVVAGLDGLPDGGLIQHADVIRMICTDLGVDHPVPAGSDVREQPREFAVTQRGGARARAKLDAIGEHDERFPADRFHTADLTSIRTTEWRYQTSTEGSELFDLPDEETDVSGEHPSVAERLDEQCQAWLADVGRPIGSPGTAEFDEDVRAQLRELGYLQ